MIRRTRARRQPQPALGVDELAIFLGNDRVLAHKVLRMLRIAAFDPKRPARVPLHRLRAWLDRQRP